MPVSTATAAGTSVARNTNGEVVGAKAGERKLVTVIAGLREPETDLPALLTQLKNRCGAGGTLRDDAIEIQGHHLDRVRELLRELGYRVRG